MINESTYVAPDIDGAPRRMTFWRKFGQWLGRAKQLASLPHNVFADDDDPLRGSGLAWGKELGALHYNSLAEGGISLIRPSPTFDIEWPSCFPMPLLFSDKVLPNALSIMGRSILQCDAKFQQKILDS